MIEGAYYRNCSGSLIGPIKKTHAIYYGYIDSNGVTYTPAGQVYMEIKNDVMDLIIDKPLKADGTPWEEKVDKKMVSIELPEWYVRKVAEKGQDATLKLPWVSYNNCVVWHKANPEPKKTRPMTEKERMEWLYNNCDKIKNIYVHTKDAKNEIIWANTLFNCCFKQFFETTHYYYTGDKKEHSFEKEVEQ